MPPDDIAPLVGFSVFFVSFALVLVLRGPLGRALARRIEGVSGVAGEVTAKLAQLESRVAETEQLPARVAELEERLDFAERLLARVHEPPRLPESRR